MATTTCLLLTYPIYLDKHMVSKILTKFDHTGFFLSLPVCTWHYDNVAMHVTGFCRTKIVDFMTAEQDETSWLAKQYELIIIINYLLNLKWKSLHRIYWENFSPMVIFIIQEKSENVKKVEYNQKSFRYKSFKWKTFFSFGFI